MEYRKLSSIYYESKEQYDEEYHNRFNSVSTYMLPMSVKNNTAFVMIRTNI